MLELFFDSSVVVRMGFISEGATVTKHHYKELLHHKYNLFHHNCPELWDRKNWLLLLDPSPENHSVLMQ
jgi:hypothetical protein